MVDHVIPKGSADITKSWLFHPECTVVMEADRVSTEDHGQGNLAIVPAAPSAWRLNGL